MYRLGSSVISNHRFNRVVTWEAVVGGLQVFADSRIISNVWLYVTLGFSITAAGRQKQLVFSSKIWNKLLSGNHLLPVSLSKAVQQVLVCFFFWIKGSLLPSHSAHLFLTLFTASPWEQITSPPHLYSADLTMIIPPTVIQTQYERKGTTQHNMQ